MDISFLEKLLHNEIPLSKYMNTSLKLNDENTILLTCPKAPNKNHKDTVFGGSLFSACALTSYAQILFSLSQINIQTKNIVVADSQIKFKRPVIDNFKVICRTNNLNLSELKKSYEEHNRAELLIECQVFNANDDISLKNSCVEFKGKFVIKTEIPI